MNRTRRLVLTVLVSLSLNIFICLSAHAEFLLKEKKTYPLSSEPIDVIFVCHPKDKRTLDLAIAGVRKHIKNIRRIIVISDRKLTDEAEWFDEAKYPFSKSDIAMEIFRGDQAAAYHYLALPNSRIGWVFKQIMNLYTPFIVPDISSNVLTIDADTIFLNDVEFIDSQGNALYNPGGENHHPYFEHAARLLPGFVKVFPEYSGISHHILMQRPILEDLFNMIKSVHNTEPWRALCRCIDLKELPGSAIAEYEIYFNFAFARTNQVKLRLLKWENMRFDMRIVREYERAGYHYVSCHTYIG